MKNLKLLFLLSLVALFFSQCDTKKLVTDSTEVVNDVVNDTKEEVENTTEVVDANIEAVDNQGVEVNSEPPVSSMVDQSQEKVIINSLNQTGTISTIIKNYQTTSPLSGVTIKKGENTICTSNESGGCELTSVNKIDTYTISKSNYLTQSVIFDDFLYLKKSAFYLKNSSNNFTKVHLKGSVKNGDGNNIYNVKIKCAGVEVDLTDGKYSLDIPKTNQNYSLEFENGFEPSQVVKMTLNTNQDSVIVDVFIDGFNLQ